jgi:predicted metal-binding protein
MNVAAKVGIREHADEKGTVCNIERYENQLFLHEIECDERTKASCATCEMFGKNLACPPFSPDLLEYVANARTAKIICYRVALKHFRAATIVASYHAAFGKVRDLLLGELIKHRSAGRIVAGCGPCRACPHCAVERGNDTCSYPSKTICSLESLGVNLVALSKKAFNISLEWSGENFAAAYVSAIGAVFE